MLMTTILTCALANSLAHQEITIGPNGGLMLDLSKDHSVQGEVTQKGNQFQIALFDKEMKPFAAGQQMLTATSGDRNKPEKLTVDKKDGKFIVPAQKGDDYWYIFQFRPTAEAKPVTARLHYQAAVCPECKKAEWLCDCVKKKDAKK